MLFFATITKVKSLSFISVSMVTFQTGTLTEDGLNMHSVVTSDNGK